MVMKLWLECGIKMPIDFILYYNNQEVNMLAEYKDYVYIANVKDEQVTLLTYNQSKMLEGFEPKRDYFKKVVDKNVYHILHSHKNHLYLRLS